MKIPRGKKSKGPKSYLTECMDLDTLCAAFNIPAEERERALAELKLKHGVSDG